MYRAILKAYMIHVYKWRGEFILDDGLSFKEHDLFKELKEEILNELKLSEDIYKDQHIIVTLDDMAIREETLAKGISLAPLE